MLANPDVTVTLTRPALLAMLLQGTPLEELVQAGEVTVQGDPSSFAAIMDSAVQFDPLFNLVTPLAPTATEDGQATLPPITSLETD